MAYTGRHVSIEAYFSHHWTLATLKLNGGLKLDNWVGQSDRTAGSDSMVTLTTWLPRTHTELSNLPGCVLATFPTVRCESPAAVMMGE